MRLTLFTFLSFLSFLSFLFLLAGCHSNPSVPEDQTLHLKLFDAGPTTVWLHITSTNNVSQRTISLTRDAGTGEIEFYKNIISSRDTIIADIAVLPNRPYSYRASLWEGNARKEYSKSISVRTMDTTGQVYDWNKYLFGDNIASSELLDICVINDTCIWAVGDIYYRDSTSSIGYNLMEACFLNQSEPFASCKKSVFSR